MRRCCEWSDSRFREESIEGRDDSADSVDTEEAFQFSSLFHGFPGFGRSSPILIASSGGQRPMKLSIETAVLGGTRTGEPRKLTPFSQRFLSVKRYPR